MRSCKQHPRICILGGEGIGNMTGVQDPYEEPTEPDLVIDAAESDPEASCGELVAGPRRPGKPSQKQPPTPRRAPASRLSAGQRSRRPWAPFARVSTVVVMLEYRVLQAASSPKLVWHGPTSFKDNARATSCQPGAIIVSG